MARAGCCWAGGGKLAAGTGQRIGAAADGVGRTNVSRRGCCRGRGRRGAARESQRVGRWRQAEAGVVSAAENADRKVFESARLLSRAGVAVRGAVPGLAGEWRGAGRGAQPGRAPSRERPEPSAAPVPTSAARAGPGRLGLAWRRWERGGIARRGRGLGSRRGGSGRGLAARRMPVVRNLNPSHGCLPNKFFVCESRVFFGIWRTNRHVATVESLTLGQGSRRTARPSRCCRGASRECQWHGGGMECHGP
jgi:hypothetical protein